MKDGRHQMAQVYFYLNQADYNKVKDLTRIEDFTLWHPQLVWSWGTFFRLRQRGYDVQLTPIVPDRGIVVMPAIYPELLQKPPDGVLFVCTVADSPPPFFMQVLITQNPYQPLQYRNFFRWPRWHHIPHWPQPGIVPRDKSRGDKFETVAYFGHPGQLAPELLTGDFRAELAKTGIRFIIEDKNLSDFSDVDAVIAVREFSGQPFHFKPCTKLVNAWVAGVPVIAGRESAFAAVRKSELDFLAVKTKADLVKAVHKLKEDKALRGKMVQNGLRRASQFSDESLVKAWADFLFADAQRLYEKWTGANGLQKKIFYLDVSLSRLSRSVKNRIGARIYRMTKRTGF